MLYPFNYRGIYLFFSSIMISHVRVLFQGLYKKSVQDETFDFFAHMLLQVSQCGGTLFDVFSPDCFFDVFLPLLYTKYSAQVYNFT